jgi:threonine/homoserine/homoserine lactone efflux protein
MLAAVGTALWLGILTSVSPCPLATNVAAMGFIGRRTDSARGALWTGLLYTAGRALAYAALGMILVNGLMAVPAVSGWLQENMIRLLGPVLIITGLMLLEWLTFGTGGGRFTGWVQRRASVMGLGAAFFLGVMFALAFCPVSAALFFGSLLPVCLQAGSGFWLPLVYGVGTALPVLAFGLVLAFAAGRVGQVFDKVTAVEKWARRLTGGVFLGVGVWFVLVYSLRVI